MDASLTLLCSSRAGVPERGRLPHQPSELLTRASYSYLELTSSPQVCYLPTNTCKDQLSFSLRARAECSSSAECGEHEVCYTPDKVRAVWCSPELTREV